MKKLLAGILSLALAASMSIPAFAATSTGGNTSIPVSGTYQAGAEAADVISVDIAWDAMDFTYTAPSKGTWNPKTHEYENAAAGGWAPTNSADPKITVTNHSNAVVMVSFAFNSTVRGLTGAFTGLSDDTMTLPSAEETDLEDAPTGETAFSVSGAGIEQNETLGTITVTVTQEAGSDTASGITTFEALQDAVNEGGTVTLGDDITLENILEISTEAPLLLDLNGYTVTGSDYGISLISGRCTITGGNITVTNGMAVTNIGESLTIDQCTLYSSLPTLYSGSSSTVTTIKDSTLIRTPDSEYAVFNDAGTVFLEGAVDIIGIMEGDITVRPGTYNFDVSSYVDTALYDVTNDGATWVVTAK